MSIAIYSSNYPFLSRSLLLLLFLIFPHPVFSWFFVTLLPCIWRYRLKKKSTRCFPLFSYLQFTVNVKIFRKFFYYIPETFKCLFLSLDFYLLVFLIVQVMLLWAWRSISLSLQFTSSSVSRTSNIPCYIDHYILYRNSPLFSCLWTIFSSHLILIFQIGNLTKKDVRLLALKC